MSSLKSKISKLPKTPGVYEFLDKKGKILYIGKATSLRDRVGSYFRFAKGSTLAAAKVEPWSDGRPNIALMMPDVADIKIHKTDSVLEALILEANLIKKHQPKYNVMTKDDKSFVYLVITKEEFPRVLILRETDLFKRSDRAAKKECGRTSKTKKILNTKYQILYTKAYGPYMSKHQMEIALKLIRRIFPFHSMKAHTEKGCLDFQIGRCPGPYAGVITRVDYLKNIHGIEMILMGKKKYLLKELEKQMRKYSKKNNFEKAAEARNRIFALEHIRDVALISSDFQGSTLAAAKVEPLRIEAYDISNIGGDFATGAMVVFAGAKPDKSQYRKFKIMTIGGIDDVGMMREVLRRRFQNDWPLPDLIFVDGGKGHLNMAQNVVAEYGHDIPVVAVAKGPTRKKTDVYHTKIALAFREIISNNRLVERIMGEAHRFAIGYHKKLRRKNWKNRS